MSLFSYLIILCDGRGQYVEPIGVFETEEEAKIYCDFQSKPQLFYFFKKIPRLLYEKHTMKDLKRQMKKQKKGAGE